MHQCLSLIKHLSFNQGNIDVKVSDPAVKAITSNIKAQAYAAAGQAGGAFHSVGVLKAYQVKPA